MAEKKLRTARLTVTVAIQMALQSIKLLDKISNCLTDHNQKLKAELSKHQLTGRQPSAGLTYQDLCFISGVLRDYATLRIANIVDENPSTKSLKNFSPVNLSKIKKLPEVRKIIEARDNWIGHINKRYIGPVDINDLCNSKVIDLLEYLNYLICTQTIKEQ